MENLSRTSKTIKNIKVDLFFCLLMFFIAFFSRRIFLSNLGADFLGFIATIQGIIGILNLMECGVLESICFSLYKPLAENNYREINEIISFLRVLYRRIGCCIFFSGCILAFFLPKIFHNTPFPTGIIYFAYFASFVPALFAYFINYPAVVFTADQKRYVLSGYMQTLSSTRLLVQLVSAYFFSNIVLHICISFCTDALYVLVIKWRVAKNYPWLHIVDKSFKQLSAQYTVIKTKIFQICIHKICYFVQGQLTPILIFWYAALKDVAYYENYMNVAMKLFLISEAILGSTYASVGNLVAISTKEKSFDIFQQLFSLRMLIAGFVCFMFYEQLHPFIQLWLGVEYLMPRWMLWYILLYSFFAITRGAADQFLTGMGMYSDFYVSIIESILFLAGAMSLGYFYGLLGILIAKGFSQSLTLLLWKPFYLFSKGFHKKIFQYWILWIKNIVACVFSSTICIVLLKYFANDTVISWRFFVLRTGTLGLCYLFIILPLYFYFIPGGRAFLMRLNGIVFNHFLTNMKEQ